MSLTGFIIPLTANPRAGLASHLEGVMNGTFLLALGCAGSELRLGALAGRFVPEVAAPRELPTPRGKKELGDGS